jgi:putative DNA methylase
MATSRPDLTPLVGRELTVIAWLWARTVKSPNPAFAQVDVPLASTFMLSTKPGKEAYVEPVIEGGLPAPQSEVARQAGSYRFTVKVGKPKDAETAKNGTKLARGANFRCLMSGTPIEAGYIRSEAQAGRMGARLMAIVAGGERGRVYLAPTLEHETIARLAKPTWKPDLKVPTPCHDVDRLPMYGMPTWGDAFTPRQLVALTTFSDLVREARERVKGDALAAGVPDDGRGLDTGGTGGQAYADAVGMYLGLGISRLADAQNSLCQWGPSADQTQHLFRRQAVPMVWDYAESSVFSDAAGDLVTSLQSMCRVLGQLGTGPGGLSVHDNAQNQCLSSGKAVSTDPPYYDNVGYADLLRC